MKRLIIQIPCLNEEATLPVTLKDIPKMIDGIDEIKIVVVDDGSTDRTAEVARECGVDRIVRHKKQKGLARAFMTGLDESLRLGADIIVNTDGDNQYPGSDIPKLIQPILREEADIVIGSRNMENISHFSWMKKKLQRVGSMIVRKLSGAEVDDATSGFRAFSREAAFRINVVSSYTYTIETIIQTGQMQLVVKSVSIRTNEKLRESRLINNLLQYISKSLVTMLKIFTIYQPLKVFAWLGGTFFLAGVILGLRELYIQFYGTMEERHFALLCAILLIFGFNFIILGLLAELISSNRHLIEDILLKMKRREINGKLNSEKNIHIITSESVNKE